MRKWERHTTHIQKHAHTACMRKYAHTCMLAHTVNTHACTHGQMHARVRARTDAHACTYTHTHAHAHARINAGSCAPLLADLAAAFHLPLATVAAWQAAFLLDAAPQVGAGPGGFKKN